MRLTADTLIEITPGPREGELSIGFTNPERNSFAELILPLEATKRLSDELRLFLDKKHKEELFRQLLEEKLSWVLSHAAGSNGYATSFNGQGYGCRWDPIQSQYVVRDLHTGDLGRVPHLPTCWSLRFR